MSQEFGGPWTDDKLKRVREYLVAYRTIFAKNPRAKYFGTWYVDAFAGSGSRTHSPVAPRDVLFADVYSDQDREAYKNGSARIALELQNPFDRYLFIDTSRQKLAQLKTSVVRDFPKLLSRCEFDSKDANKSLQRWCSERNWDKERAVVFLDPFGMQVDWRTIETLATTRAVDLWYLFPLGIGVARLLPHHGEIDEQWRGALTRVFGTSDWQKRFYKSRLQPTFFGDNEILEREAGLEKIQGYVEERLAGCFAKVAKGRLLRNSKGMPLYLLCFAVANKRGASIALNIAQSILKD